MDFDSGCNDLNQKISEWLKWDKNEKNLEEIRSLIQCENWDSLKKRLQSRLAFGTAGLRGVMQAGFNAMNDLVVIQTAQGLCKYLIECYPKPEDRARGIVLGYDGRYHSKRFAELSACVFLNENIPVLLYSEIIGTPFIPFAVFEKKCLAGIMVTASHNPKEDNGYKVYWSNSAQIIPPHDSNIQNSILKNLEPLESSWNLDILKSPKLQDPFKEMTELYYNKLYENIPIRFITDFNQTSDLKFVYTAMHGVGYPYVKKCFEKAKLKSLVPVMEQRDPDPEFPTVKFPNPEEGKSSLTLSIKLANEIGCSVILANDPDADRLACAELNTTTNSWHVFTGNELGTLLGWWSIQCFKEKFPDSSLSDCYLLASTVSSKMLKSMGKIDGFNFEETLTGFKWMGNKSVDLIEQGKSVLFAFEEAIGFMFSPTVKDKDGISAAIQLATLCCFLRKEKNLSLAEKLNELYLQYGYHYTMTSYFICHEPKVITRIFERIRNWDGSTGSYPTAVLNGKYIISSIRDLTTGKDTSQENGLAIFPISKGSQMITFSFSNGVVVTLRTSGTEPKIKYYAEMCANPSETDWENLRRILKELVESVVDELLQPEQNNLIAQSK